MKRPLQKSKKVRGLIFILVCTSLRVYPEADWSNFTTMNS